VEHTKLAKDFYPLRVMGCLEGSEVGTIFQNQGLDSRVELGHQDYGSWKGGLGTQVSYQALDITGDEAYIPNSDTFAPALFLFEKYEMSPMFDWNFGSRYEFHQVNPIDRQTIEHHPIGFSTGPAWHSLDDEYSAGLTAAYTERAPNVSELFANGGHVATRTFEIGDEELGKERSTGLDLVVRKNKGRVTVEASSFYQSYQDYIALLPTGEVSDGLDVFHYVPADVYFWGFELESTLHLLEGFHHRAHITGQIDYVRARNTSNDGNLPRIPPLQGRLILGYGYKEFESNIEGIFAAAQDDTAEYETETAGYGLLNLDLSYDMPMRAVDLEFYVRGENLGDQEARLHTSFLKDLAPLEGRAFLAGIRGYF
jgi:iron complex outermembrane receptor protein